MTNLFIVPATDPPARRHIEDTVARPVDPVRLRGLGEASLKVARSARGRLRVWGTRPGKKNRNVGPWEAMAPGDWVLFYLDRHFPFGAQVLATERSASVAKRLWGDADDGSTWELMYLLDGLRHLDAPRLATLRALGYENADFYPRGFTRVARSFGSGEDVIERRLSDLAEYGGAVKRAVEAAQAGDDVTAAIAGDRLLAGVSKKALEEIVGAYTSSEPPRVREALSKRIERNRRLSAKLKALYDGRCQCCGFTFEKEDGKPYSEAAHLRRISLREADLDTKDNIVVLCPNHHKMLDFGAIEIEYDAGEDRLLMRDKDRTIELENRHIGANRAGTRKR